MTGWGKLSLFVGVLLVVQVHSYRKDWKQIYRCGWERCEPNCRKVKGDDGCYKCECKPLCSPPKCVPGCEVETVFDGPCPGCKCKEIPQEKVCEPVKCGVPCKEVPGGPGECPRCVCEVIDDKIADKPGDIVCDPPKCPPGCDIETEFDGPCPGCDCKYEFIQCPVLVFSCHDPNCNLVQDENGCDICKCFPQCSIPRCPRRCRLEEKEDGCPVCQCTKRKFRWNHKQD